MDLQSLHFEKISRIRTENAFVKSLEINNYNPQMPFDNDGWMDSNVMRIFEKVRHPELFIEVGSWKGRSAIAFATELQKVNAKLLCVDTWLGAPEFWTWGRHQQERGESLRIQHGYPSVFFTFLSNVFHKKLQNTIRPFPISSVEGAKVLKFHNVVADAIYIDGAHEKESVARDLRAYFPLLRHGGVMFGDDYSCHWEGVVEAVNEFAEEEDLRMEIAGVVWFLQRKMA